VALPQNLGRLTLLHHLGSDTYSTWWLYQDPDRGAPVVVRALADQWIQHPQARADFVGGTGPFQPIVSQPGSVLDSGEAPDGTPYVVTPYSPPPTSPPPAGPPQFAPPAGWGTPRPPRKRWPLVVGIIAAVVVLGLVCLVAIGLAFSTTGSSGPSISVQSGEPAVPGNPSAPSGPGARPAVGECRNLSDAAVPRSSDSTPVVDCSQPHTAQTYYVGTFPSGSSGAKPDSTYAGAVCQKHLGAGLGVSESEAALTAYQVVFFAPDSAAWAAGARWFRCDVALTVGNHLLPLPSTLVPHPLPPSLQACLTRQGQPTPCDRTHLVRASGTFTVTGSNPTQSQAQGRAKCPSGSVYFTWPSAAEFKQGLRVGVCWSAGQPNLGSPT